MRYVVVLECPVAGLEGLDKCFNSDLCRITKFNERWVLESSEFNVCSKPNDVFPLADKTLSDVRRILALYRGLSYAFTVSSIQCIDDNGRPSGNCIRASLTVMIVSPTAVTELGTPIHGQPIGTAIYEGALKDSKIKEALELYQDTENRWPDVYNIIEFLGGPDGIGKLGFGTKTEAEVVKRTANHYRHLGATKPYPVPTKPPTLNDAAFFAKRLLRGWLESRLDRSGTHGKTHKQLR
jgi:hypothetical protein